MPVPSVTISALRLPRAEPSTHSAQPAQVASLPKLKSNSGSRSAIPAFIRSDVIPGRFGAKWRVPNRSTSPGAPTPTLAARAPGVVAAG